MITWRLFFSPSTKKAARGGRKEFLPALEQLEGRLAPAASLVRDINTNTVHSYPKNLIDVSGTVYFNAYQDKNTFGLWKSDGTRDGTVLLTGQQVNVKFIDFQNEVDPAVIPQNLTNVNGTVYFTADHGTGTGGELWKTDGTINGTVLVKDINTRYKHGSYPGFLTNVNGTLFFVADNGLSGRELWKSDGSEAGTVMVKEIRAGSYGIVPALEQGVFTNMNGVLYFSANDGVNGYELWRSDGTVDGTFLVKNIRVGSQSSLGEYNATPNIFENVNNVLFFEANDGIHGFEIWKSDGTANGTVLVKDVRAGSNGGISKVGNNKSGANINGIFYFSADDGVVGRELWKSDGTTSGTTLVKDIYPGISPNPLIGNQSSIPQELTNIGGVLFFSAYAENSGRELWKSDGTTTGTVLVKDIGGFSAESAPRELTNVNGTLYFNANDGIYGNELWKSDGTANGTVMVADIQRESSVASDFVRKGSNPRSLTNVNGKLYFNANDGIYGNELWKSDGNKAGTVLVKDLFSTMSKDSTALRSFISSSNEIANVNGIVYFCASKGSGTTSGHELWKSDGTEEGTVLVKDIFSGPKSSYPNHLTNVNGVLFFVANDGVNGRELWRSDGTEAGTFLIKDIVTGTDFFTGIQSSNPTYLTNMNGILYFSAGELWKSDGTAAGTIIVKDPNPNVNRFGFPKRLSNVNGTLFFFANDDSTGYELWKSDGSTNGTMLVKDINLGLNDSSNGIFDPFITNVNGIAYFRANDGINGYELWKSDGTLDGTSRLTNAFSDTIISLNPYILEHGLRSLTNVNGILYFSANDNANGWELWKSDGTATGTRLAKDISIGPANSAPSNLINVNGALFFTAEDINGREVWKSDGTSNGTTMVLDIRGRGLARYPSPPSNLTNINGKLYFTANNESNGIELWKSDGTAQNTVLVMDINPGSLDSDPKYLTNVGGTLYFRANDGIHGNELWKYVGNEKPTDLTISSLTLHQNAGPNAVVGAFSTTDPDYGNSFTYTLVTGAGSTDNGLFNISSNMLRANASFDSTFTSSFSVRVRTTDQDGLSFERAFTIAVVNPRGVGASLVRDIQLLGSGRISNIVTVNSTTFFTAEGDGVGIELWKSDGTADGTHLLKDICPGQTGSSPMFFVNVNGILYFSAYDGIHGQELWKSDGTTNGTSIVKDICIGSEHSLPSNLTNLNGVLFFSAYDGIHGQELWKSDGTANGTVMVKDGVAGALGSNPGYLSNMNGVIYFVGFDEITGAELWKTDGTANGTMLVKDIWAGGSSFPRSLTNVNGTLYFTAYNDLLGRELWKSDGTELGTVLVKDIKPGTGASAFSNYVSSNFLNVNGTLFFTANNFTGYELWKSDGTANGTVLLKDIRLDSGFSGLHHFTNVNGTLFFTANNGNNGYELWKSNGTTNGTSIVKDICIGTENSRPNNLTNLNGVLFFSASDGINGRELWKSDGTANGTVMVKDGVAGALGSNPGYLSNTNGILYFTASDGTTGYGLAKSDGTAHGTELVKIIKIPTLDSYPGGWTNYFEDVNGTLYFSANTFELWKSNGTLTGTTIVENSGLRLRSGLKSFTNVNGILFFSGTDGSHGYELWKSDGINTTMVSDIRLGAGGSFPTCFTNMNGKLYFVANDGVNGYELWQSDGTTNGTIRISNSFADNINGNYIGPSISNLVNMNGYLFFVANDGLSGNELWKTNGTSSGVVMVKDIATGPMSSKPENFLVVNDSLYFTANNGANGYELWKSDGSPNGTMMLKDICPGSGNSNPGNLTNVNGTLFFRAATISGRYQLWKSDGTAIDTIMLKDPRIWLRDQEPGNFNNLTNVNGILYFSSSDGARGSELWKSDGTPNGTILVKDIRTGSASSDPASLINVNGTLFFTANDGLNGRELWRSDGNEADTVLVEDIYVGSQSSIDSVSQIVNLNGVVYFAANDGITGRELWKYRSSAQINMEPTGLMLSPSTTNENKGLNSVVGLLTTTDVDTDDTFIYSLVTGTGSTDNNLFNISGSQLRANNNFDFEDRSSYSVRVRTTDQGGLFLEQSFMITVADVNEPPTELWLSSNSVAENANLNAVVGSLTTSDPDANSNFSYSLVAGLGSDDNTLFNISGNQLRANSSFNFESRSNYSVRMRTTDQGGLSFERSFTITVSNANESPTALSLSFTSIAENAGSNAFVGILTTTHPDAGDTLTYSMVTGTGSTDNGLFNINGNQLRANTSFDFESRSSYTVRVRTTDQGGLSFERSFAITVTNVNESPTALSLSSTSIVENAGTNALVGMLTTTDPDAGNTFTYSMVTGTGSTDNGLFNISGNQLRANASFDFETQSSYSVLVRTTDQGGLSFDRAFTITVRNVDEGPSLLAPISAGLVTNQVTIISGLSVVDPLAGATRLTTTVSVPSGKLTLGTRTGLVFLTGDGVSDATIRFTGTLSQTNTALKSLSYITATDTLAATMLSVSTQRGTLTGRSTVGLTTAENRVARVSDPSLAGKVSVVIQGTGSNDTISVQRSGATANYTVTINSTPTVVSGVTGRFIVFGLGGDDDINMSGSAVAVRADGGEGHDVIQGGSAADTLFGGNGADLLSGGLGADNINGGAGNDIVIDGTVAVRTAGKTLRSILDGWAARVAPIDADYGAITTDLLFTADKASKDTLTGGLGTDWFWSPNTTGILADTLDKLAVERRRLV